MNQHNSKHMKKTIEKKTVEKKIMKQPSTTWAGRVPKLKQGKYSDGLPYDEVSYLSFKLILKPNRFVSRNSLFAFAKVIRKSANKCDVGFKTIGFNNAPIKIREVLFIDTPDFRLYNNAFILRRRICYEDGFPASDPEIVFKYRHPEMQRAAEVDVRPQIHGNHRVKFKCQVLPLKDQLGGIRLLFSHNVQFPRSHAQQNDVLNFEVISQIFPALAGLQKERGERIKLVNETIIEEVLQDIGMIDFGNGMKAKASVAIWRTRGEHRPLIGEFAYQLRFKDRKELGLKEMQKAEKFFIDLQYSAKDWLALNATKTGIVYRLLGNAPKAHE
jgi:hypothetical protein